jgi:hypothetical protein
VSFYAFFCFFDAKMIGVRGNFTERLVHRCRYPVLPSVFEKINKKVASNQCFAIFTLGFVVSNI